MTEIRDVLGLDRDDLPNYSTIYKSFDRLKCGYGGRCCAFQRSNTRSLVLRTRQHVLRPRRASSYFRQRSGNTVQTLKVTTLTDVESLAVLEVHIAARWKHDTKTGSQVVRVPADDLLTVAADNGFQDWKTEYEIAALDIDYLVYYRGSSPNAVMSNALIRAKGYTQRWMAEIRTRQQSARTASPSERWAGIEVP